jgi:hypothetical protein
MTSSTIANVNGQPTWEISSTSASVSGFSTTTNAAVNKPEVSFTVDFTNTQPIDLLVTDLAFGAGATDAELKALFDPLIIDNTGINWTGFRIDLVDVDDSATTVNSVHPNWAHFHDSTLTGWLNPITGVFPYNPNEGYDRITGLPHTPPAGGFSSLTGASELRLSGGTFAAGTSESWSHIGIHEWGASVSTASSFVIELTPISETKMTWSQSPAFFSDFGANQGWNSPNFKRVVQDIDNNFPNTVDYVGFGFDHVTLAWGGTVAGPQSSQGPGFIESSKSFQIHDFGTAEGYDNTYLRGVDLIGGSGVSSLDSAVWASGNAGFYFYQPTSETGVKDILGNFHFEATYSGPFFVPNFGHNQGWDTTHGIDVVLAKNTDASASILGFGDNGLVVDRAAFGTVANTTTYTVNVAVGNLAGGYNNLNDIRTFQDFNHKTIDLNHDGFADFVGFGPQGLQFAFGGTDAAGNYVISNPVTANIGFGPGGADLGDAQGWTNTNSVRDLIDLNGDGFLDVVAFGFDGVYVAMGQDPNTHGGQPFGKLYKASSDFGTLQGWNTTDNLRLLGDVNGDGIKDIVGFGANTTFLVLGSKNAAGQVVWDASQVTDPTHQIHDLTKAQGWSTTANVRALGDVNGDGHADIVASGIFGTSVWSFA